MDPDGRWTLWGPQEVIVRQLFHEQARRLLVEADHWIRGRRDSQASQAVTGSRGRESSPKDGTRPGWMSQAT